MAKYKTGQKVTLKKVTIDIEITGYFPAGQTTDGKAEYAVTINGYKARIKEEFINMLEAYQAKDDVLKSDNEEVMTEQAKNNCGLNLPPEMSDEEKVDKRENEPEKTEAKKVPESTVNKTDNVSELNQEKKQSDNSLKTGKTGKKK